MNFQQVIKGWDEGILGGDGVPPMQAGMDIYHIKECVQQVLQRI